MQSLFLRTLENNRNHASHASVGPKRVSLTRSTPFGSRQMDMQTQDELPLAARESSPGCVHLARCLRE